MTGGTAGTMSRNDSLSAALSTVLDAVEFPAARGDLLLHAISTHASPALIGEIRSLPDVRFRDAEAVRDAISRP